MPNVLDAASLRSGILQPVFAAFPDLAAMSNDVLDAACSAAQHEVEAALGTRFAVTRFIPWSGTGLPPEVDGQDIDDPYPWPGRVPGDGFPRFKLRVRPVLTVESISLRTPGSLMAPFQVPDDWIQVDRVAQEILICPTSGAAVLGSLIGGGLGFGMFGSRSPNSVLITYTAGLGPAGLAKWPQIRRILELRTVISLLGQVSLFINPSALSNVSADGLSQSRSSGYAFKDMEDRLSAEADALQTTLLNRWDGLMPIVL